MFTYLVRPRDYAKAFAVVLAVQHWVAQACVLIGNRDPFSKVWDKSPLLIPMLLALLGVFSLFQLKWAKNPLASEPESSSDEDPQGLEMVVIGGHADSWQ